jgi:sensor histidine kinase YesM
MAALANNTDQLFRFLFHLFFWGMLLAWPLLNFYGNEEMWQYAVKIFPISLTNIPLFFLNTDLLIPRLLRRKGVGPYLLSLLVLIAAFVVLKLIMRYFLLGPEKFILERVAFITVVFVLMVTATGTVYGLITDLAIQERAKQEEQRERLQSELAFLRSQISPHFIFNILNSLVYLIRTQSPLAEAVTIKLAELMRYVLYESADRQVPLNREVEYLKNYIELQQLRFEEDVDIRLQIEQGAGDQLIEPMLMIPFVENAFKHGVGLAQERPVIDIAIDSSQEGQLHFAVKNKIVPESSEAKDDSSGIGLKNVKRRLELLYPERHHLQIAQKNGWFAVALTLNTLRP